MSVKEIEIPDRTAELQHKIEELKGVIAFQAIERQRLTERLETLQRNRFRNYPYVSTPTGRRARQWCANIFGNGSHGVMYESRAAADAEKVRYPRNGGEPEHRGECIQVAEVI